MDGLIAYALAKKYTDKVGQDIISAGFKVQVEDNRSILNRQGEEKVLYLLPKEYGSSQDGYDEFVYANNNWEWVGKTDVSLDYELLENKPLINGVNGDYRSVHYSLLSAGLDFEYKKFYVSQLSDKHIYIQLSNRIPFVEYLVEYDFNNLKSSQFGNTSYVVQESDALVLNFPEELDIDRTKLYFISAFTYGRTTSVDYNISIRKVIGCSKTGEYKEYAQIISHGSYSYDTDEYEVIENTPWVELTGGGTQIVSAVVNANGTITFTDSDGNSFTTSGSNLVTSSNEQISMGYDEGGFYFLFDDGQEEVNNGTD